MLGQFHMLHKWIVVAYNLKIVFACMHIHCVPVCTYRECAEYCRLLFCPSSGSIGLVQGYRNFTKLICIQICIQIV